MGSNQKTLQTYEKSVPDYIGGTKQEVTGVCKAWIDEALAELSPDARILEIGSGFGRDAAYIESRGFRVECTDAVEGFVAHLKTQGLSARFLNALTDPLGDDLDLILANGVLVHFSREESEAFMKKALGALKAGGAFAFSVKKGAGEEWSTAKVGAERYFCYWTQEEIVALLECSGFAWWTILHDDPSPTPTSPWIRVTARKS